MKKKPKLKRKVKMSPPAGAVDELTIQNMLRKRHSSDYPNVILQLTKRIQAVNQTWAQIITKLIRINGLRIAWYPKSDDTGLVIEIKYNTEIESHFIPAKELHQACQYIEVLLMDKVDKSKLIAKAFADLDKNPE